MGGAASPNRGDGATGRNVNGRRECLAKAFRGQDFSVCGLGDCGGSGATPQESLRYVQGERLWSKLPQPPVASSVIISSFETVASLPEPIRRSLGRNRENRLGTRSMPPSWPPVRRTA